MPRAGDNLFSAARGRIRALMNKYNLFNMYKARAPRFGRKTLFQQKWLAKQETRAYHGEHIREKQWKQLFDLKLQSVAQLDASLKGVEVPATPLPLQTFAPLERRLETALFRAMFALLVRQARDFVKAGSVCVNGVVVRNGSFPLRSGDMFSVDPEKVLLAMGRAKPSLAAALRTDLRQIAAWNRHVRLAKANPLDVWNMQQARPALLDPQKAAPTHDTDAQMREAQRSTTRELVLAAVLGAKAAAQPWPFSEKNHARCARVYELLADAEHPLVALHGAAECAAFVRQKAADFGSDAERTLAHKTKKILQEIVAEHMEHLRVAANGPSFSQFTSDFAKRLVPHKPLDKALVLENEASAHVALPWQRGLFGRQDPLKAYFTPWTPRPFLGAFAVLPAHIEVSFATCHAVYLRDPVARPGHSEVISPFPVAVHERAYMYYARKGM